MNIIICGAGVGFTIAQLSEQGHSITVITHREDIQKIDDALDVKAIVEKELIHLF